jgi:hypothetical protein
VGIFRWYEEQRSGLGAIFRTALDDAIQAGPECTARIDKHDWYLGGCVDEDLGKLSTLRARLPTLRYRAALFFLYEVQDPTKQLKYGKNPPVNHTAAEAALKSGVACGSLVESRWIDRGQAHDTQVGRILDEIDASLRTSPAVRTARRKVLVGATPSFEHVEPVWQFRVGDFRVIYDVDGQDRLVTVRAVVHKGNKTTGEIL